MTNPSPSDSSHPWYFNGGFYLRQYPDVAAAGMDPHYHYTAHGRDEWRSPNRPHHAIFTTSRFLRHLILVIRAKDFDTRYGNPPQTFTQRSRSIEFDLARHGWQVALALFLNFERLCARLCGIVLDTRIIGIERIAPGNCRYPIEVLQPQGRMQFREPDIIGETEQRPLREVAVPEQWIATIPDAAVVGGFQVIKDGKLVVYEPAADPTAGFVAGIWPYFGRLAESRDQAVLWFPYKRREHLDEAILISGRASPNYYHWLIEYLGRMYLLKDKPELKTVPLIIDDGMFPSEFESLDVAYPGWPAHRLKQDTLLTVGTLHVPSIPTYVPDNLDVPFWQGAALNHAQVEYLRQRIFAGFGIDPASIQPTRKIYLGRRGVRSLLNATEVEAALERSGFEIVDTGQMTLKQQVELMLQTRVLAGPLGAAHTNLIFCHPGTEVIAMASPYAKRFTLQANLARFAGCHYRIIVGDAPGYQPGEEERTREVAKLHASFSVDPVKLEQALRAYP